MEHALADRALAEERDGDEALLEHGRRERRADRDQDAGAHDRVRAEVPGLAVGDVHRARAARA